MRITRSLAAMKSILEQQQTSGLKIFSYYREYQLAIPKQVFC